MTIKTLDSDPPPNTTEPSFSYLLILAHSDTVQSYVPDAHGHITNCPGVLISGVDSVL